MLTTATVYTFLFIHIGVILVVTAYYTLGAALAPTLTEGARIRLARRAWLPLTLGVVVSVPWVLAALLLLQADQGTVKFAGAVLGCGWVLAGLLGGAGIAQHVGRGASDDGPSWLTSVRGGLLITLTWVLPLVGWLVMLPLTLATGVGCLLLGFVPPRSSADAASPAVLP